MISPLRSPAAGWPGRRGGGGPLFSMAEVHSASVAADVGRASFAAAASPSMKGLRRERQGRHARWKLSKRAPP
jgi:hypothetical protein